MCGRPVGWDVGGTSLYVISGGNLEERRTPFEDTFEASTPSWPRLFSLQELRPSRAQRRCVRRASRVRSS